MVKEDEIAFCMYDEKTATWKMVDGIASITLYFDSSIEKEIFESFLDSKDFVEGYKHFITNKSSSGVKYNA